MKKEFYGHGKLMLTGEYTVLDGATSLALRTRVGQRLIVTPSPDMEKALLWESIDSNGGEWFWGVFSPAGDVMSATDMATSARLSSFLKVCIEKNPEFNIAGFTARVESEFDLSWGLGSSSSLIYTLARWAEVDPYDVLDGAFTGSGYDIAAAHPSQHNALLYNRIDGNPRWEDVDFSPSYADEIYFVYSGQKQNSREGIKAYHTLSGEKRRAVIPSIDEISKKMLSADSLSGFEECMEEHENIMSSLLEMESVKKQKFADFTTGSVKSLGAWGGDFYMATGKDAPEYFMSKGYEVIFPFASLIEK